MQAVNSTISAERSIFEAEKATLSRDKVKLARDKAKMEGEIKTLQLGEALRHGTKPKGGLGKEKIAPPVGNHKPVVKPVDNAGVETWSVDVAGAQETMQGQLVTAAQTIVELREANVELKESADALAEVTERQANELRKLGHYGSRSKSASQSAGLSPPVRRVPLSRDNIGSEF